MKQGIVRLRHALFALALASCGGGQHALVPSSPARAATSVSFVIVVPASSTASARIRPAYVSAATKSVSIAVNGAAPVIVNLTPSSPNCAPSGASLQCTVALTLAPGPATFDEVMYDQLGAAGNELSSGHQVATISSGQANIVKITLDGIVASIAVALDNPIVQGTGASVQVAVGAKDADQNTIAGGDPYASPITVTDSDTSGATSLSVVSAASRARVRSVGVVHTVRPASQGAQSVTVNSPGDVVTLNYNGAPANVVLSASAPNVTAQNVTSATVSPKTASTADWSRAGFDGARTSYNPAETTLSVSNAAQLKQKWSFTLGGPYANTQPIVATNVLKADGTYVDVVFVGDEHGGFYALNAADGSQLWTKQFGAENEGCGDMPDQTFGNTSAPLFDRKTNRVYLLATDPAENASDHTQDVRRLYAFDPATGNPSPGWTANVAYINALRNNTYSGLNISADGNTLYFDSSSNCDIGPYYGTLGIVNVSTQSVSAYQAVLNTATYSGNGIWSWSNPVIDPDDQSVFMAAGNAFPENDPNSDSVIHLSPSGSELTKWQSPNDAGDDDFGTAPVAFDEQGSRCMALGQKSGTFYVFNRASLAAGPVQSFGVGDALVTPAYDPATHQLFMTANTYEGATTGGNVQAYSIGANCSLTRAWTSNGGAQVTYSSVPAVANGVVYVAGTNHVYALSAATGNTIWTGPATPFLIVASPTVADGRVYALSWASGNGGKASLFAYGL